MKSIKLLIIVFLFSARVFAQDYASIYIEGDGETPFYVKVEGQMQERLAKDYFIIPNLDAGYTNIEILFQQNIYPVQKFLIAIPKSGTRGFALQKVNDRQFALYDLQEKRYIVSGNEKKDDWVSEANPESKFVDHTQPATEKKVGEKGTSTDELPKFGSEKKIKKVTEKVASKPVEKVTEIEPNEESEMQPQFISGIELNSNAPQTTTASNRETSSNRPHPKKVKTGNTKQDIEDLPVYKLDEEGKLVKKNKETETRMDLPEVPNSDCPTAMDNDQFEDFALLFLNQTDDDKKLKFLSKNKKTHCFSTEQVRILGNNLETQSGRYEVVKMLYIQTSDQENYGRLEALFNTNFLKSKFKELINP